MFKPDPVASGKTSERPEIHKRNAYAVHRYVYEHNIINETRDKKNNKLIAVFKFLEAFSADLLASFKLSGICLNIHTDHRREHYNPSPKSGCYV